jgi:hypothetical protein
LSDKYLEVAPPTGDPGPAVREGQELRGVDPPSLDNVLQHTWVNITVFKLFIDTVRPELDAVVHQIAELRRQLDGLAGAGEVGAAIAAAGALVRSARHTHDGALGGEPGLAALGATVGQARETVAQLRAAIDVLGPRADAFAANLGRVRGQLAAADPVERSRRAFAQLRAALDKIDPLLAMIDELGDRIARGEGSLGRLMTDPEFSDDARDLGKVMKRHPWKFLERPKD